MHKQLRTCGDGKAVDQAQHDLDGAVAQQHKAATALNKAQQEHDASIADEQSAKKALSVSIH